MVKNILSASHTLRALTLLLLSVCAFHGAWADDKQTQDPIGTVVFHIPEGMVNGASHHAFQADRRALLRHPHQLHVLQEQG